jgi:hypothetical protein
VVLAAPNDEELWVFHGAELTVRAARDGAVRRTARVGFGGAVSQAHFDAARKTCALYNPAEGLTVHAVGDLAQLASFPIQASEVQLSADGQYVAATHFDRLTLWSVRKGMIWAASADEHLRNPRICPEDNRLAAVSDLGTLYVLSPDGRKLLERDMGALCALAWLPGGDLLAACWMGPVVRLDRQYRERWRSWVRPTDGDLRPALLAADPTPTARLGEFGNAELVAAPLTPNLLKQTPFTISYGTQRRGGENAGQLQHAAGLLFDGKLDPPPGPWLDWYVVNTEMEQVGLSYLVLDAGEALVEIDAVTMAEDPSQPQSWLRDARLEWWDTDKKVWVAGRRLLSNRPLHTHRLAKPVRTTKVRLAMPAGANPRLAEVVLHGSLRGQAAPVPKKPPVAPKLPADPLDLGL